MTTVNLANLLLVLAAGSVVASLALLHFCYNFIGILATFQHYVARLDKSSNKRLHFLFVHSTNCTGLSWPTRKASSFIQV
jgi:hypothetical protein